MKTVNTHGLTIINDVKSFPVGSGRYEVNFGERGHYTDRSGTMDTFESACREAAQLLRERADWVSVFDFTRGYVVATGRV